MSAWLDFLFPNLLLPGCLQIGETPFLVAVDHDMKTVVISIRGTLSLQVPSPRSGMVGGDGFGTSAVQAHCGSALDG